MRVCMGVDILVLPVNGEMTEGNNNFKEKKKTEALHAWRNLNYGHVDHFLL